MRKLDKYTIRGLAFDVIARRPPPTVTLSNPPDVRRLTIYGDAERPVYKSRASFTGHIDWDRLVDLAASGQIVKNHNSQMTRLTKSDLSQATQLDELSIEGNHMTVCNNLLLTSVDAIS